MRPETAAYAPTYGLVLYCRSRALPLTVATLLGTALLAAVCAHRLNAYTDPYQHVPLVMALAPMIAAAVIGNSLYQHSAELERTAVRPAWPRRLAHLLALTTLAAGTLALAVPGHAQEFGAPVMVRNLVGAVGITAVAATVIGARLSWLPTVAYLGAVSLAGGGAPGRAAMIWAWAVQPGPQPAAWAAAAGTFVVGGALYAVRGARPESPHD
ncbi:hypothetical protein AB0I10_03545 [Streptomyces sp. NPDC050636]|uniref:hypothetical protein n=1 Tax=Streptomyces sp. NPDC050636 TaxID=3154510 RepID=UPI00343109BA